MIKYIIQRKDGVVEYYAGPLYLTSKRVTSIAALATRYVEEIEASRMAETLQRANRDGSYSVRPIDVQIG